MTVLQLRDVEEGASSRAEGLLAKDAHDQLAVFNQNPREDKETNCFRSIGETRLVKVTF